MNSNLSFLEYEKEISRHRLPSSGTDYVALGLIGEVGELYGKWAKSIRDNTELDHSDIKKELGDVLWFLAALCHDLDTNLTEVAHMNIVKLSKRSIKGTLQGSGDNRE